MEQAKGQAVELFRDRFGVAPEAIGVAPGRVELLGNHTDYNGGYVMSAAIDRVTATAGAAREDDVIEIVSALYPGERVELIRDEWRRDELPRWARYIAGTLKELSESGAPLRGMRLAVASTVPLGGGLSSSAALEVSVAQAALQLAPKNFDKMQVAQLCKRAENLFVGVNSGLLDQFSAMFGAENCALYMDCATLENRQIPFGEESVALIIANSMAEHKLADGAYNRLHSECMEAASRLGEMVGREAKWLRDITFAEFERHADELPENLRKRARHVMTENQRVLDGVAALERGDLSTYGRMMFGSHASSRDDFGNSVPELDALVELAKNGPGIIGARLTGGGFGGCTVNLVHGESADAFIAYLKQSFKHLADKETEIRRFQIGRGAWGERLQAK